MKVSPEEPIPSLSELEAEAEAYGRQVAREYLQSKLQQLADTRGAVFPPQPTTPLASAPPPAALAHRAG